MVLHVALRAESFPANGIEALEGSFIFMDSSVSFEVLSPLKVLLTGGADKVLFIRSPRARFRFDYCAIRSPTFLADLLRVAVLRLPLGFLPLGIATDFVVEGVLFHEGSR